MSLSSSYVFMFMRLVLLLLMLHIILIYSSSSMQPRCHESESYALLQFKASFLINNSASGDPCVHPKAASWKPEGGISDCCSWDGVECDENTDHVVGLDLSSSCLYGSLDSSNSIFSLIHLQKLSLADNHFNYSQIPSGVGHLTRLTHLNLSRSKFSGQIPSEISQLTQLSSLDLSYNSDSYFENFLELTQPNLLSLIQNLTGLEELHLNGARISSPMPNLLANSSSLTSLLLENCGLYGFFPTDIFLLPNLESLNIGFNQELTGYLPEFHWSSPLKSLRLGFTNFSNELPASIGNLYSLNELEIHNCHFSGPIPSSIGNLTELHSLDLSFNKLQGQIPFSLANLTQLTFLSLSFNNFTGGTLSWIGKPTKLTDLYLQGININGQIPSVLANCSQLVSLDLGSNQLIGPIPSGFVNLTHLQHLWLESNQITGQIPFTLTNLTQLVILDISDNKLQGPIPSTLSESLGTLDLSTNNLSGTTEVEVFLKVKNLNVLNLSKNNLTLLTKTSSNTTQKFLYLELGSCNLQEFPNFLHNQDKLWWVGLSHNNIRGKIPKWMWNISRTLLFLDLSYNFLTGFVQHPLVLPWTGILLFDIRFNALQGPLPLPPPSILFYVVSNNKLSGELSPFICNSTSLLILDLSNNNLSGVLPQCLATFSDSLSILNLGSNNFRGTVPESWTNGSQLKMIDLSQNQLQGQVPRSWANCTRLEFLHIGNNHINDVFPSWLGVLQKLSVLILRSNEFHGAIGKPETDFEFPKLHIVDLSNNSFSGSLPSKYFQNWNSMKVIDVDQLTYMEQHLQQTSYGFVKYDDYYFVLMINNKGMEMVYMKISNKVTAIDLSSNKFEGEIPESVGSLQGLRFLNLSNNILSGHIPSSLVNLTVLESLDLSRNMLSGDISQQLTQLSFLAFFNVSHNHLVGPIPRGNQFNILENSSFEGNSGLCGDPLSRKCGNSGATLPVPSSTIEVDQDSGSPIELDWKIVLMGYGSGLVVGVVIGDTLYMRIYEWFGNTLGRRHQKWRKYNRRGGSNRL